MAIVKTGQNLTFKKLHRGAPFAANVTLYSRTGGKEDPKEHLFYKLNSHKAVTVDKRTEVHFTGDELVSVCNMEKKKAA
jgi:hypothetical protein